MRPAALPVAMTATATNAASPMRFLAMPLTLLITIRPGTTCPLTPQSKAIAAGATRQPDRGQVVMT